MGEFIVCDACLLITFGNANALDIMLGLETHPIGTCQRALNEVARGVAHRLVNQAVAGGRLPIRNIDLEIPEESAALAMFDAMPAFRGRADAEVLALGATRGYVIGSDDAAVRRCALAPPRAVRPSGSLDFLLHAVRESRLTAVSAEALLDVLDTGPAIRALLVQRKLKLKDLI